MNTMTPSKVMTDNQIDKTVDLFRSALRKHHDEFSIESVQQALGAKDLGSDLLAVFRGYVERFSNLVIRLVRPDRNRTPQAVLDATDRKQYTDSNVVASMPRGTGEETKVVFFKLGHFISDVDLDKEYELRGLKPADPYSLAAVNEVDPAFADKHPNTTHWKDAEGNWCYAAFYRWNDFERRVDVNRLDDDWYGFWWFAGLAS